MFKVRAYQTFDGSGVYEAEGQLHFIEAPYTSAQSRMITPAQLQYLNRQLDYTLVEISFATFAEIKGYLEVQANSWKNPYGNAAVDEATLLKGFSALSEQALEGMIKSLRSEQLEAGKIQELRVALNRLWKINKITSSPILREELRKLETEVASLIALLDQIQKAPSVAMFQRFQLHYPNLPLQAALLNPVAA